MAASAPAPIVSELPRPMPRALQIAFGSYFILLSVTLIYILFKIWPPEIPLKDGDQLVHLFWDRESWYLTAEKRYLAIVVVAGALGSYIHAATSFSDFVGNRRLFESWSWWYLLRPFIGMALALMTYFAVRGGLVASSTAADALSPYGIATIAGLAGMFSKQASDKLREVFENLFKTDKPPERSDKLA